MMNLTCFSLLHLSLVGSEKSRFLFYFSNFVIGGFKVE